MRAVSTCLLLFIVIKLATSLELGHIRTESEIDERIAGGDLAKQNQFPHQVGLSIEYSTGLYSWCGGSLISEQWILTAAHCVEDIQLITVYLGSVKRLEPSIVYRLRPYDVRIHHEWSKHTLLNDIALLRLPAAVHFTDSIRAVSLPRLATTHSTYAYHESIATGWGRMSDASPAISNDLHYIIRYVQSNAECQHVYGNTLRSTHICIDTTGGKSTCTGDSGGPLIIHDESINKYVLIGLTSFGKSSGCTKGYPAVFTRITSYLDWIQAVSGVANLGESSSH